MNRKADDWVYDIDSGFPNWVDCACERELTGYINLNNIATGSISISGSTDGIETLLTSIISRLNNISGNTNTIASGTTLMTSQLSSLTGLTTVISSGVTELVQDIADVIAPSTYFINTSTTTGSIPVNATSWTIVNLGVTPNEPESPRNPMIINSIPITTYILQSSATATGLRRLGTAINYNANGNTLLISYTI